MYLLFSYQISAQNFSLELARNKLFRFVIYYTDADRTNLIATSSDIILDAPAVRANREQFRIDWMPFVVREVNAITRLPAIDTETLMNLILDAFQFGAQSKREALYSHLKSLGVDHPRTFFKSVHSFGSANQSLELYDSNSCYE